MPDFALNIRVINNTTPNGHKHGCHNRASFETHNVVGLIAYPNRMSKDCMYDLKLHDKACIGCRWSRNTTKECDEQV